MTLTDRHRAIFNRAAELGGERYRLSFDAKDDPARWARLAEIASERALLEIELQHLYVSSNN